MSEHKQPGGWEGMPRVSGSALQLPSLQLNLIIQAEKKKWTGLEVPDGHRPALRSFREELLQAWTLPIVAMVKPIKRGESRP